MKKTQYTILSAIVLSLVSCGKKQEAAVQTEELPVVTLELAHMQSVAQNKEYTATVEAENLNNISPATPNRIKKINADVGDHVRAGQVLVVMDQANVNQLKINLDQMEREYRRAAELLAIGAGTQQQVDQLKAQLDAARTQYNNIQENSILRSPISGVVTARNYDPGDMTGNMPILSVGQLSPFVKLLINVNEGDMALIHKGMPVQVSFDAYPGEEFSGKISRIYPTVDATTRTFGVEVQIANKAEKIKPGMFARVTIDLGAQNHVVVPDRAVVKQTGSGGKYVYVYRNGKVTFCKVELGQRIDAAYELLSGINDGDSVVTSGQSQLVDGAQVTVKK